MSQGHLLQNIVSFVGLFCKSTGMRECVSRGYRYMWQNNLLHVSQRDVLYMSGRDLLYVTKRPSICHKETYFTETFYICQAFFRGLVSFTGLFSHICRSLFTHLYFSFHTSIFVVYMSGVRWCTHPVPACYHGAGMCECRWRYGRHKCVIKYASLWQMLGLFVTCNRFLWEICQCGDAPT